MGILRTFVNGLFKKNFNIIFVKNIKSSNILANFFFFNINFL